MMDYALKQVKRTDDFERLYIYNDATVYKFCYPVSDYMDMSGRKMPESKRPAIAIYHGRLTLAQAIDGLIEAAGDCADNCDLAYYRIAIELLADPTTLRKS